jgi:hypothetical protein
MGSLLWGECTVVTRAREKGLKDEELGLLAYIAFTDSCYRKLSLSAGLAGCTQRGKIPRGWIFGGEEERGAFGGVKRAWDCLFGEAERLNCVCYDLLSWRIELEHGKDVIGIGDVDMLGRDTDVEEVVGKSMYRC